jgi:hypothetical protein
MRPRATILAALVLVAAPAAARDEGAAPADRPTHLVVLPVVDLSGGAADRDAIDGALGPAVAAAGFDVVPREAVVELLRRQRMRFTGGVTPAERTAMRDDLAADGVVVASVDLYDAGPPPRVALTARLLTTDAGRIVWAHDAALSGLDHPGVLGRGEVHDLDLLIDQCVRGLVESLDASGLARRSALDAASGVWREADERARHRPRRVFRDGDLTAALRRPTRIAVLPFDGRAVRADAGDVVAGLFTTHLAGRDGLDVIEPGEVRAALLAGRVIQEQGLSLAQADVLRELLDADLAVTGRLIDYADFVGAPVPRVAFSVWVIDVRRRAVVWSAYSANQGDDGVVFFRIGRVGTARALASSMVRSAAAELARELAPQERPR